MLPGEIPAGSHELHDVQATLIAASPSKAKLLLKDDYKKEIVVVGDGKLVWTSIPGQHEYTEVAARSANTPTPEYVYVLRIGTQGISGADPLVDSALRRHLKKEVQRQEKENQVGRPRGQERWQLSNAAHRLRQCRKRPISNADPHT